MYSKKVSISLFIAIFQWCNIFKSVSGECCPGYWIQLCKPDQVYSGYIAQPYCLDCTALWTPQFCSYDWCNVFGCNCSGGCRTGRCQSGCEYQNQEQLNARNDINATANVVYPKPMFTLATILQQADKDGDGLLDMNEAFNWVSIIHGKNATKEELVSKIEVLDKNADGYISLQEIDNE